LLSDLRQIFNFELFKLQAQPVTLQTAVIALLILIAGYVIAGFLRAALRRIRLQVGGRGNSTLYLAERILYYVIVVTGILVALSTIGIQLGQLALFAGALGVGVGLGMQDIARDFIGGIILVLDKSIDVGDFVETSTGLTGEIQEIGARCTRIRTNDNVDILVPNSAMMQGHVTNWTRGYETRRVHVPFSVMFGADKEKVRKAALEAASSVAFTLPDEGARRAQCWLVGFGDNGLKFELVVWPSLDAVKRPASMYAGYYWALDDAMRKHGIEMPYPQMDVRMRSLFGQEGGKALEAMGLSRPAAPPIAPVRRHGATHNDAAADLMARAAEETEIKAANAVTPIPPATAAE
jgi:small-conductance mechanosensitive channel